MKSRLPISILPSALLLALFCPPGWSAVDWGFAAQDGGRAGAFLDFAASARSMGMGHAHVGVADDASAAYWNPAGLAHIERKDVVTSYSSLAMNSSLGVVNFAQP